MQGTNDAASDFEWAVLACTEFATCTAGVDEPAVDLMPGDAFAGEHLSIAARLKVMDQDKRKEGTRCATHRKANEGGAVWRKWG